MTTMDIMKNVRNEVAGIFGENNVTDLQFKVENMRYHKEYDYSFKVNSKTVVTLRSGYEATYIGAFYELSLSQNVGDKVKTIGKVRLTKQDISENAITNLLHDKFKLPRKI